MPSRTAIWNSITPNEQVVEVAVLDEGPGFDWRRYLDFDPERAFHAHGRGIAMANRLSFDTLHYCGRGNEVVVCMGSMQPAAELPTAFAA